MHPHFSCRWLLYWFGLSNPTWARSQNKLELEQVKLRPLETRFPTLTILAFSKAQRVQTFSLSAENTRYFQTISRRCRHRILVSSILQTDIQSPNTSPTKFTATTSWKYQICYGPVRDFKTRIAHILAVWTYLLLKMVSIESLDLSAENTNTYRLKDAKRLGVYQSTRRWRTKQVFLTGRGKECGNVFCVVCFLEIQDVENQTILTEDIIFRSGTNKNTHTHTHPLWGFLGFTIPSSMRNGNRNLQRKVPTTFCEKLHRASFTDRCTPPPGCSSSDGWPPVS